jgi:hypothetical protein
MSDILKIIILIVFTLVCFLIVIYQIFVPRGNPSKLISDIFKIKRSGIELNDKVKVDNTILGLRIVAGILFGLVYIHIYIWPSTIREIIPFYPWISHVFLPLSF